MVLQAIDAWAVISVLTEGFPPKRKKTGGCAHSAIPRRKMTLRCCRGRRGASQYAHKRKSSSEHFFLYSEPGRLGGSLHGKASTPPQQAATLKIHAWQIPLFEKSRSLRQRLIFKTSNRSNSKCIAWQNFNIPISFTFHHSSGSPL